MPHIPYHPSAAKRHRQSLKRRERNHAIKTRMRGGVKQAVETMAETDRTVAEQALRTATKLLNKAASSGVIHRNTAARKISRLTKRLARTGAPVPS